MTVTVYRLIMKSNGAEETVICRYFRFSSTK